jgi:hypothetical protein
LQARVTKCESELETAQSNLTQLLSEHQTLTDALNQLSIIDVDAALASLHAALEGIKGLDKQEVSLVRSMKKPPKVRHCVYEHRLDIRIVD